jgi:SAM-dependent methyltransferase
VSYAGTDFGGTGFAGAEFWDRFFRERRESGDDLDWGGLWTEPFLIPLREASARTVLELGCGTGNDAARLAGEGYSVTAVDVSREAIDQAQARYGAMARFAVADMTRRLPFADAGFDAVMSNVAMHMFPDSVTRAVFAEVGRLVRPDGLFLFHVNALEDRPLRARWRPARELEADYVIEESGQTMHFFSEAYLRELLSGWRELELAPVRIAQGGERFKQVWRGIARRLASREARGVYRGVPDAGED